MGEVIRSSAAVDDIFGDLRTSLDNAIAKDGIVRGIAVERLTPILVMIDTVHTDLRAAQDELRPLAAELSAENDRADAMLDRTYDEIWNDLGRPANDRILTLLFPGGAGYYTDGETSEQPQRMELLAQLFDRRIHPKLSPEQSGMYATRVRQGANALARDVEAARLPSARVRLYERIRTTLGRMAQVELANLKRAFKNEGMTEAQIHTIIPDRPPAKKKSDKGESTAKAKKEAPAAAKEKPTKDEPTTDEPTKEEPTKEAPVKGEPENAAKPTPSPAT